MQWRRVGTAMVVTGPSGAGKSTVCKPVLTSEPDLHFAVSCTTRTPRPGEQNGVEYFFLSQDEFKTRIQANAFFEYAEVHGHFYGTPRNEVEPFLAEGRDVLLDIDVQGARQFRQRIAGTAAGQAAVFVFIAPPSLAILEQRLRSRQTESEASLQRRLADARDEMTAWREYDYLVVNDQAETATEQLHAILIASRCRICQWE